MSDPTTSSASLHGPGGLLSTPGLGGARRRKWGTRREAVCTCGVATKDALPPGVTRIHGNLCNVHGRYGPCDASAAAKPKGRARKPRAPKKAALTPEQKRAARDAQHSQNQSATLAKLNITPEGQAALTALRAGQQPDPKAVEAGGFEQAGLVTRAQDGSYHLTASGRAALGAAQSGDAGRTGDIVSSARDRASAAATRVQARTQRQQAAAQKKQQTQARHDAVATRRAKKQPTSAASAPKQATPAKLHGPSATSGHSAVISPKPPTPAKAAPAPKADPAAAQARNLTNAGDATGLGDNLANLDQFSQGKALRPQDAAYLVSQGLLEQAADGPRQTTLGKAVLSAAKKGDVQSAKDALSRARESVKTKASDYPDQSQYAGYTMDDWDDGLGAKKATREEVERARAQFARTLGVDTVAQPAAKSFTVFKDHTGAHRWIARTTTAYRDRDQEIISSAALDQDSQRMTAAKSFGPLRYWHVGTPEPLDVMQPWGPGLDIGDCDYSVLIGRTRVESGTFRDAHTARAVAAQAGQYEMSPGFFYGDGQPDAAGVFSAIRTFERSLVPIQYARASNLFTGFSTKEHHMDSAEMERRFKVAIADLGLDGAQAAALGQQLVAAEKSAQAQGIAFKSEAQPQNITMNFTIPPNVSQEGMAEAFKEAFAKMKAFPPAKPDAAPGADPGMTSVEEKAPIDAAPVDSTADPMAEPDAAPEGDYIGDMSVDDFKAMLSELLAPVLRLQDMVKSIGDMHGEMKGMMGGVQTKEAGKTAEIAALKARLDELEGRQPATILPTEVEAAMKSAGPVTPADPVPPTLIDAVNDPNRPWAGWGAQTFPELYQLPKQS